VPSNYPTRASALRQALGLTSEEVAEQVSVDRSTLFRHENGEVADPGMSIVVELARLYGVSVDFLVGETDTFRREDHDQMFKEVAGIYGRATQGGRLRILWAVRELRLEDEDE
tara:strand:+ start:193 stop:531 length:339 start_codon:yes stop_codon:yes gene_type:complete